MRWTRRGLRETSSSWRETRSTRSGRSPSARWRRPGPPSGTRRESWGTRRRGTRWRSRWGGPCCYCNNNIPDVCIHWGWLICLARVCVCVFPCIQVYKQKVKHLLYEHQNNITELKRDGQCTVCAYSGRGFKSHPTQLQCYCFFKHCLL